MSKNERNDRCRKILGLLGLSFEAMILGTLAEGYELAVP